MQRRTVKNSTIFINVGAETMVFRSVKDVPEHLRRRLSETTSGHRAATIIIADERGREEIAKALQRLPDSSTAAEKSPPARVVVPSRFLVLSLVTLSLVLLLLVLKLV